MNEYSKYLLLICFILNNLVVNTCQSVCERPVVEAPNQCIGKKERKKYLLAESVLHTLSDKLHMLYRAVDGAVHILTSS